jgi:hypothetical protein
MLRMLVAWPKLEQGKVEGVTATPIYLVNLAQEEVLLNWVVGKWVIKCGLS